MLVLHLVRCQQGLYRCCNLFKCCMLHIGLQSVGLSDLISVQSITIRTSRYRGLKHSDKCLRTLLRGIQMLILDRTVCKILIQVTIILEMCVSCTPNLSPRSRFALPRLSLISTKKSSSMGRILRLGPGFI